MRDRVLKNAKGVRANTMSHAKSELLAAMGDYRGALVAVGLFSAIVNLLMLTGPLFMLQVYDRVLASRSSATLLVLLIIVIFLYGLMGLLDHLRGRILARIGAGFQAKLDTRVFDAVLRQAEMPQLRDRPASGLRDLSTIQGFLSSPLPGALFDLPWAPFFVVLLFVFHPLMGWFAVAGAVLLVILAVWNQLATKASQEAAVKAAAEAESRTEITRKQIETVRGLGMTTPLVELWQKARTQSLLAVMKAADAGGGIAATTKAFRMFLQSGILALGAWLVLQGQLTGGAMIAGSILLGRALAPIEQSVGQWGQLQRASLAWRTLDALLNAVQIIPAPMALPRPSAHLSVQNLVVVPMGEKVPTVQGLNFEVLPGEAVAVIGPSASGKSSLARALVGLWPALQGAIRLGGAELSHYDRNVLGRLLGYLPQDVILFPGSVHENIARFDPAAKPEDVVHAARAAGAHELILSLPQGYDTVLMENGGKLSGGQRQRIGLARAFYGNPVVLILDEPNSSLDDPGTQALNQAIAHAKRAGQSVLIMSHRPSALAECDKVLMLENGRQRAFGPRDEVLQRVLKGPASLVTVPARGTA
jgi:ATP-binding cassette subfamily C protein